MEFIAHIRQSDQEVQTVAQHLIEVCALTETYGGKIGVKHIAGLAGMLHDLGKYTREFRDYLIEAVTNPDAPPKRGSVDHSTAGGRLLYQLFHERNIVRNKALIAEVVGNAIISHHSYLQDFLNPDLKSPYLIRVRDKVATELEEFAEIKKNFFQNVIDEQAFYEYVERADEELEAFLAKDSLKTTEEKLLFLSKFIFSALIDADRTNTRLFEENQVSKERKNSKTLFEGYYEQLVEKVNSFPSNTPINALRAAMSQQCDQYAEKTSGIYTLSIPTGGGKTLSSLRYALKHAKLYDKKRIIYVVPYTTIIEQNAAEVRNILIDDENILEHHSNVIEDISYNDEPEDGVMTIEQKLKLAKDNWDVPIIFTTMVQLLNTFYAKGNRNTRRLHNLSEAVIIFDEVQKVPVSCISLFNQSVNFLRTYCKSSIILCTATQPALDFVHHKLDISPDAEIVENLEDVREAFKRVEVIDYTIKAVDTNELASFIRDKSQEVNSILIILNTKSVVKSLYEKLKEDESVPIYHLSTSMCASHRNDILTEVRQRLKENEPTICVSTQLIEAGVDVSFDCVIRSLAGLDSIAQAAGRCNRHGEKEVGHVYIVDHKEENLTRLKEIKVGKQIAKKLLKDIEHQEESYATRILSTELMERYFKLYYTELQGKLDYFVPQLEKNMTELLMETKYNYSYYQAYCSKEQKQLPLFLANSYKTAADYFEVIDSITTSVIVPYGYGKEIIAELNGSTTIDNLTSLLKRAQQFTINLHKFEVEQLAKHDGLVSCLKGSLFVLKEGSYDDEYGLAINNDSILNLSIF